MEQTVTLAGEPGMIPAVASVAIKAKRIAINKAERIEQKSSRAERSMKATGTRKATMTSSKTANRSTSKTKSSVKTRIVKTKTVVLVNAPEETTIALGKTMPSVEAEPQSPVLSQSMGEPAGVEACAGSGTSAIREICFEPEIVVPDESFDEKNSVFSTNELEVITDRVQLHQAPESRLISILRWLSGAWKWAQKIGFRHPKKRLRVCETVALGEKRFVAVIEVDGEQFLVGGGSSSVATLARLEPMQEFSAVLKRRWAQEPVQV